MNIKFWEKIKLKGGSSVMEKITILLAEFFGTAFLLFVGCLACTLDSKKSISNTFPTSYNGSQIPEHADNDEKALGTPPTVSVEAALAFGLAVMIAMQCFGHVSGGHVNPLVTIGAIITGYVPVIDSLFFFLGQFLGALGGFGLLRLLLLTKAIYSSESIKKSEPASPYREFEVYDAGICAGVIPIKPGNALMIEFMASFILVMTICGIWDAKNKNKPDSSPMRFGLTVTALILATTPFTSGHFNTARTFAPAVLNNFWVHHWVYWAGQLAGAIIAAILYSIVFSSSQSASSAPAYDEEKD